MPPVNAIEIADRHRTMAEVVGKVIERAKETHGKVGQVFNLP